MKKIDMTRPFWNVAPDLVYDHTDFKSRFILHALRRNFDRLPFHWDDTITKTV